MIYKNIKYNPTKDLKAVEPFGFVNLVESIEKGEIPAGIANTEESYNNIDDPTTIIGKPSDIFDAYRMADYVKTNGKSETKTDE